MNKKRKYLIGVDIGGTKILAAVMNRHFRVLASAKARLDIRKGEKGFLKTLESTVEEALKLAKIKLKTVAALGVGCPGMLDVQKGLVKLSPNIPFLNNFPLRKSLTRIFKLPVVIENDVNAGLYGEFHFGAAKGFRDVVGIFLGTGVGGAMILNGEIYRGAAGAAGEIGHTFVSLPNSFSEEKAGTLENEVGRLAIAAEAGRLILKQQAKHLYDSVDFNVRKIKSGVLSQSVKAGDLAVKKLIVRKSKLLGIAMANAVNLLNPERIVLGGGLMEALGEHILPAAQKTMEKYALKPVVKIVKVVPAALKDFAVAKGAAKLAEESLL